jgi:hypothetical protein
MAEQAMLDVSMIAHRVPLRRMLKLAQEESDALAGLVVSASLIRLLRSGEREPDYIGYLISRYFGVQRYLIDIESMRALISAEGFRRHVIPYAVDGPALVGPSGSLPSRVKDEWARQVIVEEWDFLMNHSWLFSKTRAIVDYMIDGGSNALYVTKERLEHAIEAVKGETHDIGEALRHGSDRLVGRTLKKPHNHRISPNDRVRALAKWVAVGGAGTAGLLVPAAGAVVGTAAAAFLLYDP